MKTLALSAAVQAAGRFLLSQVAGLLSDTFDRRKLWVGTEFTTVLLAVVCCRADAALTLSALDLCLGLTQTLTGPVAKVIPATLTSSVNRATLPRPWGRDRYVCIWKIYDGHILAVETLIEANHG